MQTLELFPSIQRQAVRVPRYYQAEAKALIATGYREGRTRPLVVLATGLGKTFLFCDIAKDEAQTGGRVLVLVHRDELLNQAKADLERQTGLFVGVEKAERRSYQERIVVASVQSLSKDRRLQRFAYYGAPTLIICDEAHHAYAPSWRKVLDTWPDARRLGVTATPDRTDGKGLAEVFDSPVIYDMQIDRGIDEGFLVPLLRRPVWLGQIDLSTVGSQAGDLKIGELETAMVRAVEGVCQETLRLYPDSRGPIFLPGKASANLAAERLNALRPGCARVLTDDTEPDDRQRIMREIKAGEVQFLCNVNVATEGFDWPDADIVVLARPTKSRSLYCQMVGRGTRTRKGTIDSMPAREQAKARIEAIMASAKPHCTILDFVGNSGKHKLVTLTDLFGRGYNEKERALASELEAKAAKSAKPADAREFLEEARKRLAAIAKNLRSKVTSHVEDATQLRGDAAPRDGIINPFLPASADQVADLKKAGWPNPDKLTVDQARQALNELKRRRIAKLATLKQLAAIRKATGIQDTDIPFRVASAMLNEWQENRYTLSRERAVAIARDNGYTINNSLPGHHEA